MLLLPLSAVVGQLWFCWKYPLDWEGPIKGSYLSFAALPLCALFGVGVEWAWRRGWLGRIVAGVAAIALAVIAAYCFYCRFGSAPISS